MISQDSLTASAHIRALCTIKYSWIIAELKLKVNVNNAVTI